MVIIIQVGGAKSNNYIPENILIEMANIPVIVMQPILIVESGFVHLFLTFL